MEKLVKENEAYQAGTEIEPTLLSSAKTAQRRAYSPPQVTDLGDFSDPAKTSGGSGSGSEATGALFSS